MDFQAPGPDPIMHHTRLIFWSITAALAGFLFGFDTVVISGAEKPIQTLWSLSGAMHGWAMSAALWGTVVGSMIGGLPTARYGRRNTLIAIGVLYFVSAVWSGLATDVYSFILARFIGGLGVGISTIVAPLFISEIAPAKNRGKLAGMFQFNIVFGILVAFFSNFLIGKLVEADVAWRWMVGIEALPALIYTVLAFWLPESPRWLITHARRKQEGIAVFKQINPEMSEGEIGVMVAEVEASVTRKEHAYPFWSLRLRIPILLAFLVAFFNQLSGINIILYFAPRLLDLAGIGDPLQASISLGVTNLVFTFIGLWLIDRLGRKMLLLIGSFGYILSLGICAWAFLSVVEFKVVSRAIDLESAAKEIHAIDSGDRGFRSESEVADARKNYLAARTALEAETAVAGYRGKAVTVPEGASPAEVETLARAVKTESSGILGGLSLVVLVSIMGFIAAHAVGQGAVIWVLISEIFPNDHRAAGQALGSFTHWIFAALLTLFFPMAIGAFDTGIIFAFFCGMMVLQLIWVLTLVPETKGVSLEAIQKKLGIQ
jgi:MFS family permease